MTSIDVIMPVRNGAGLVREAISSVIPQLGDDDRLVVVDDASTDRTPDIVAAYGATLVVNDIPRGPYQSRQLAAMASVADGLVFFDVRCRARAGWLESHRALLREHGVALTCSPVRAVAGRSLASKVAAYQQPFRLEATTQGSRLPYYPTCNLGVDRKAFAAVGGFPAVRSGGDAELCWSVQRAGLGRLAIDPVTYVDWVPRDSLGDLLEQWWRYGVSGADLQETHGAAPREAGGGVSALAGLASDILGRRVSPVVGLASLGFAAVQRIGQWEGRRRARPERK